MEFKRHQELVLPLEYVYMVSLPILPRHQQLVLPQEDQSLQKHLTCLHLVLWDKFVIFRK